MMEGNSLINILLFSIGLSGIVLADIQLPSPLPKIGDLVKKDTYVVHDVNFPNGVRGIPNVAYWQPLGFRPLTLDLYLPPGSVEKPSTGFPLVIYIHGGAWIGGDSRQTGPFDDFPGVLASLSAMGYVVASIEYRLSGEAKFPAQIQDVKAAIRFLRRNASKYGINPAKAVTWGTSAGGHLAALAAVSCNAEALEPKQPNIPFAPAKADPLTSSNVSDCVQGSVAWYGVFDFVTVVDQSKEDKTMPRDSAWAPEWQLLGCFGKDCKPEQITAVSPVSYVDSNDPPMLLIVGDQDRVVPYHQTLEMAEKLKAAGVKHELIVLPGSDHGFMGKTKEQTRDDNLKALSATFRFIDQTIGTSK
jgi:acetyl esterase/lipase